MKQISTWRIFSSKELGNRKLIVREVSQIEANVLILMSLPYYGMYWLLRILKQYY
jgi:hypothetical protein